MTLGNIMLGVVVICAAIYGAVVALGMIAMWPYGAIGLGVLIFFVLILVAVVRQRTSDTEGEYYSRNVDQ